MFHYMHEDSNTDMVKKIPQLHTPVVILKASVLVSSVVCAHINAETRTSFEHKSKKRKERLRHWMASADLNLLFAAFPWIEKKYFWFAITRSITDITELG